MNPNIVEKNGTIIYTNYRGVRQQAIAVLALGCIFACASVLAFIGTLEALDAEMAWFKGNLFMLFWTMAFACIAIWTAIALLRKGKSYEVMVGPGSVESHLFGKTDEIAFREINEVLFDPANDGGVKIYRAGKRVLEIPIWFFGSQAKEFVELVKNRSQLRVKWRQNPANNRIDAS